MSEREIATELAALRREYGDRGLDTPDLAPDPVEMFRRWLDDAVAAGLHEPNAMVVSTVSEAGRPSSRMVLLKGLDEQGFVFYTNYDSRKGRELGANPVASLLFPWHDLQRQVRVEGTVTQVAREESEAYFAGRPREAQLGAWASHQSEEVASRGELQAAYDEAATRFEGRPVPCPQGWGGFRVAPEVVELWQGRRGRMHDRLVYRLDLSPGGEARWSVTRLAP
jgi:pyridoxamine 5'-phosphate oxidase